MTLLYNQPLVVFDLPPLKVESFSVYARCLTLIVLTSCCLKTGRENRAQEKFVFAKLALLQIELLEEVAARKKVFGKIRRLSSALCRPVLPVTENEKFEYYVDTIH